MTPSLSLRGVSVGLLIERGRATAKDYRVHSRFETVVNLADEHGGLITLLGDRHPNFPSAARVSLPENWDWRAVVAPGEPVALRDGALHAATWRVDLAGAPCWLPSSKPASSDRPLHATLSAYSTLCTIFNEYCSTHEIHGALQLLPHWRGHNPELDIHVDVKKIDAMIGLGSGLTPDGDDYLLGYIAALWHWKIQREIAAILSRLTEIIVPRLYRTTDISRHFLSLALQGHYSESIDTLTDSLMHGESVRSAAFRVMRHGAASGVDCLAGYLNGIRSLDAVTKKEAQKEAQTETHKETQ